MKMSRKERALLYKLVEEAGEVIKAAVDLLEGKGTDAALREELADVDAIVSVANRRYTADHPRYHKKFIKYAKRFDES